jgi:prophage regulatory protein
MKQSEESELLLQPSVENHLLTQLCELQARFLRNHRSGGRMLPGGIDRLMRLDEVLGAIGVSESTIRRWEQKGHFPNRRQIGPRTVGWLQSEVENWIRKRGGAMRPGAH